jgi:hypothetical protein
MASPSDLFLTSSNYFSWKSHMEDVCTTSKGLYQITLGKEKPPLMPQRKPNGIIKMMKHMWINQNVHL